MLALITKLKFNFFLGFSTLCKSTRTKLCFAFATITFVVFATYKSKICQKSNFCSAKVQRKLLLSLLTNQRFVRKFGFRRAKGRFFYEKLSFSRKNLEPRRGLDFAPQNQLSRSESHNSLRYLIQIFALQIYDLHNKALLCKKGLCKSTICKGFRYAKGRFFYEKFNYATKICKSFALPSKKGQVLQIRDLYTLPRFA